MNRAVLLWGTYPLLCARQHDTDSLVRAAEEHSGGRMPGVERRQIVGIVAGTQTRDGGDELYAAAHDG